MKPSRLIFALLLVVVSAANALSAPERKIFAKAAETVWNTRNDLFDAKKEVPDSLAREHSAVIIADYFCVNADYEYYESGMNVTNRTKRQIWTRRMVKLLDDKAVEEFSTHEFGAKMELDVFSYKLGGFDNAFGAKVHKPDGTVIDVDINEAFDITEGKKGRKKDAVAHKIAIPGLEPGDVLEYFDYHEEWANDIDLSDINIVPFDKYPVMHYVFEGKFDPELTVEYRTYNGAHEPNAVHSKTEKNTLSLELADLGVITDKNYLRRYRQFPFIRLSTLNNTSRFRYYPRSLRRGGLYGNIPGGTIYTDIKNALAVSSYDMPLPGQVKKLVNTFRKAHPEATSHDILDATWLATIYANMTEEKNRSSDYWVAVIIADLIKKMKLTDKDVSIGFVNPRSDVETSQIMRWTQPNFGVLVGDSIYLHRDYRTFLPGELHGDFHGEQGGYYSSDRGQLTTSTLPAVFTVPIMRGNRNKTTVTALISLDPADGTASIDSKVNLSGSAKVFAEGLTNFAEWAQTVEDYLGIPEGKRYKDPEADPVARKEELTEAIDDIASQMICKDVTVEDFDITQRGIVPGAPEMKFSARLKAEGCVSDAGNDLMLSIGRFVGSNARFEGKERERVFDVYFTTPRQYQYSIVLKVPEGYEVDASSLEALGVNVTNKLGQYYAAIGLNDDGNLVVNVRERYNNYFVPAKNWPELLALFDAAAAFNDTKVLASKK